MNTAEKIQAAYASAKNYPDLAAKLIVAGILSYTVDVSSRTIIYRLAAGETHLHESTTGPFPINQNFNRDLTVKAIRDNQQGKTTYPQFMEDIANAGVRFYEATLNGNAPRVTYIGIGGFYDEKIPL